MIYNCGICMKELTIDETFQRAVGNEIIYYCQEHYIEAASNREHWSCTDCSKSLTINQLFSFNNKYYCREHYIIHQNERDDYCMAKRGRPPLVSRQQQEEQKPAAKASDDRLDALRYAIDRGEVTVFEPLDVELKTEFNEPEHYHEHDLDTIAFLQGGFSPEVHSHFCVGNIVKYAQRYPYKNGREDLEKIVDYAKRLLEWHDKNNPS